MENDKFIENNLEDVIYSILFVSGEGVDISFIAEKLEVDIKKISNAVKKLEERLSNESGVHLIKYNNKIQLSSNPNYAEHISTVLNPIRERALTRATLETLAIIAYKQPITRLEIENIRGVNSDYTVQALLDHKMIEVVGKKDAIGKPLLFGTTDEFLKRFGLSGIDELPDSEELLDRIKTIYTDEENSKELFRNYNIVEEVQEVITREEREENINISEIDLKIKKALEKVKFKIPTTEELTGFIDKNVANAE